MKKLVSPSLNSSASEIIFIDAGVNNYQLIPSNTETEIVILDSNRNGVEQITQSLSNSNNLDSIHIISQGREGAIALGTTELNLNSLQSYQNSLQSWSNALNSDADILLYGCNVAAGTTGTAFIDRLSQLTTADIAASNDITGREDLNGDWELEIATGQIEAQIAIAAKNQGLYGSVLATYNGSQYQLTSESLSWSEAQAEAKSFGGNLVVINDAAEQKWLNQTFGNTQQFWIGLSDAEQEGNFQWVDGSDRNYQNWAEGEPNDSKFDGAYPQGEDYVLMNWNSLGQWNDLSNSYGGTFRGIIEIDNNTSLSGLEPIVDYENFTSLDSLTLNGNAVGYNNRLRLTPSAKIQRGSAFFNRPLAIDGATSFSTQFEFELSGGTTGADGFTFMLQNDPRGVNALGGLGGSLGYSGLTQSLAIEFDSHFNSRYDSNNNHISVLRDGDVKNSLATTDSPFDLNGGGVLNAWVDYDGKRNLLEVYLAQNKSKPDTPLTALDLDLSDVVGERAFVGFSAATGGRTNNHDLLAWQFTTNADLLPPPASAVNLNNEIVVSDLLQPTAVEWTPDGDTMLIAQKRGVISVFKDGALLSTPFIDLSDRVNGTRDRGLLDIAVHPDFYNGSPYVYALYTYDPPEVYQNTGLARPDGKGNRAGRLTRITADASTNFTTAVPGSEVVILGTNSTWENFNGFTNSTNDIQEPPAGILPDGTNLRDFLAADSESHTIGSVEFGPDGALYVSNGDGASYNRVDPRAIRVQDIDNLSGKILRIDPITGEGLTDNPFYNGDKNANRSKVYQYGLRNPFRISIDPLDGRVYVGDVGWTTWEEINASNPGANFGWPYYEGADTFNRKTREYRDLPEAKAFYQSGESVTTAFLGLNHRSFGISAVVVGDVYRGNAFPEQYQGDLFFNDLGGGIVRNVSLDEAGNITSIDTFTTGAMVVVQISQAPDGSLYYVDLDDGLVGRWFFN